MKKKGFTLIELLAVIVILAIIALIATPIILNIIEKSKKSAFQDSVYGIMEAAKLKYTESILDGSVQERTYIIEDGLRELEYSGHVDGKGVLKVGKDGKIELAIYNEKWCIRKSLEDSDITTTKYEDSCTITGIEKDPVITLNGEVSITLKQGESYEELGVIAKTVEGNKLEYTTSITLNDIVVEKVDTNIVGTYKITYSTSSNGKNVSVSRIVMIEEKIEVNEPTLENGLVPIKWNGSSWIRADVSNPYGENQWYDYEKQMWANGASVTEEYRNVAVGTVIPEDGILAYFVWIPRYEYDYVSIANYAGGTKEQPGEIKVNFIPKSQTIASTNYKIHPAFTFGETELDGIWVGKFETTGSAATPSIKPYRTSLRNQNVSTQFATAQKFSASGNTYGISMSADSHMMKNSEWGAIVYLSQSKYGKYGNTNYTGENKEVYINNNSNDITGCSGGSPSASRVPSCTYTYEKENTGTGASTTGTIYGVYDMNGLSQECVMGLYQFKLVESIWGSNYNGGRPCNDAGFSSAPDSKYYDLYTSTTSNVACNDGVCYGHAFSETAGWYNDISNSFQSSRTWMVRGGYSSSASAGIFGTGSHRGDGNVYSFRVVLL